jgi:hypothetical protein
VGSAKRSFSLTTGSERVALSPHLAYSASGFNEYTYKGLHKDSSWQALVGDHTYTRNGGGQWKEQAVSATAVAADARQLNPYLAEQKFDALPGVHRVSATESTLTGTFAQIEPFISFEYSLTAANFQGSDIKTLTVDFWVDRSGRPVKITVAGQSSNTDYTTVETFGSYNNPQTITAP